jgi:hypothetical protein
MPLGYPGAGSHERAPRPGVAAFDTTVVGAVTTLSRGMDTNTFYFD